MSTKRWTKAEDDKLRKAKKLGISFKVVDLKGRSYSSKHQRASQLMKGTAATLSPKTVRKSAKKSERVSWTEEEDKILREGREKKLEYSDIKLKGRTTGSKRTHWNTISKAGKSKAGKSKAEKSKTTKNSWTRTEERQIRKYKKEGVQYVDMEIPGRTDTAIKYHWLNSMQKPKKQATKRSLTSRQWTPEQERALYESKSKGKPHHKIRVKGRTSSSIRNHWGVHRARITKEYAKGTPEPKVETVTVPVDTVDVEAVVTDTNRPKIGPELKKLCKGYTAHTIPVELGNYCLLLDEAVTAGWLPQDIQSESSIFEAPEEHSETEVKTLCISRKANLILKARSKVKIWKTRVATCKPDTPMAKKVAILSGLLSSRIFDKKGKSSPQSPTLSSQEG